MKNVIALGALAVVLGGCASTSPALIRDRYNVPQVPDALYNCPTLTKYPGVSTLTDRQVAALIVTLKRNNTTCKNSIEGIRQFLKNASTITG